MSDAVLTLGDPRLGVTCAPVEDVREPAFRHEAERLVAALEAFRAAHGFGRGIAAPQIGISKRFIAVRMDGRTDVLVNPEITAARAESFTLWDDCMCFPDLLVRVRRHLGLTLRWTDLEGLERVREIHDPAFAELLQHELDHLDGVLALDRAEGPNPVIDRAAFLADPASFRAQVDPYLRLRGPEAFRTTPWRNGGGVTTELAIAPEGATVSDAFGWRLSAAQVASSGPFSRFEGCDRTLLLLEGEGMDLDHGAHGQAAMARPFEPVRFSGDWDTTGTLRGGPCRDFNVITRREAWRHDLQVTEGGTFHAPEGGLVLVFAASGFFRVAGLELPEGWLLEAFGTISMEALADSAVALVVTLTPA